MGLCCRCQAGACCLGARDCPVFLAVGASLQPPSGERVLESLSMPHQRHAHHRHDSQLCPTGAEARDVAGASCNHYAVIPSDLQS